MCVCMCVCVCVCLCLSVCPSVGVCVYPIREVSQFSFKRRILERHVCWLNRLTSLYLSRIYFVNTTIVTSNCTLLPTQIFQLLSLPKVMDGLDDIRNSTDVSLD